MFKFNLIQLENTNDEHEAEQLQQLTTQTQSIEEESASFDTVVFDNLPNVFAGIMK